MSKSCFALTLLLSLSWSLPAQEDPVADTTEVKPSEVILQAVWEGTPTKAAGVGLVIQTEGTDDPTPRAYELRVTDSEGKVRLPISTHRRRVFADRDHEELVLEPGIPESATIPFRVHPRGCNILIRALDPSGKPVASAQVWLAPKGRQRFGQIIQRTDQEGRALLPHVPPGSHLTVFSDRFAPPRTRSIEPSSTDPIPQTFELKHQTASLRGRVVNASGNPLPNVAIVLGQDCFDCIPPSEEHADVIDPTPPFLTTTTDLEGRYSFPALAPRLHTLRAYPPSHSPAYAEIRPEDSPILHCDLMAQAPTALIVTVLSSTGTPVPDASVEVQVNNFPELFTRRTSPAGTTHFLLLPPDGARITATTPTSQTSQTTTLTPGPPTLLRLRLP